ncbi:MAG: DNA polymerase III subunit chi [Gammaproteobacteria bacterium]|jgi:DNA polymerase III subunit chi|nr:DNA polymerase III subunit chi [Gammaproteobacteria bacterium]MCH1550020.1 DNA polymerase III subunit chi [Pseudomonadales bacterium]
MTRVDFYILEDQTLDASLRFACRLSLKAYLSRQPVHIHVADTKTASDLDELMWNYPKHRFVPHEIAASKQPASSPIQISSQMPHRNEGLLINLALDVPVFFGRFDRVAEIIVGETKEQGRQRYSHYRDRGYPLHHHELSDWERTE